MQKETVRGHLFNFFIFSWNSYLSFTAFLSACVNSPDVTVDGCCVVKTASPGRESVCMHVFVWPCVPLLSTVILPASGFDKDKHCGGKWIISCLHFVFCVHVTVPCVSNRRLVDNASSCLMCTFSCKSIQNLNMQPRGSAIGYMQIRPIEDINVALMCTRTAKLY